MGPEHPVNVSPTPLVRCSGPRPEPIPNKPSLKPNLNPSGASFPHPSNSKRVHPTRRSPCRNPCPQTSRIQHFVSSPSNSLRAGVSVKTPSVTLTHSRGCSRPGLFCSVPTSAMLRAPSPACPVAPFIFHWSGRRPPQKPPGGTRRRSCLLQGPCQTANRPLRPPKGGCQRACRILRNQTATKRNS